MSSNNEYEHQSSWVKKQEQSHIEEQQKFIDAMMKNLEIPPGDGIMAQIERGHDDRSERLLKEINTPENIKAINNFFKNYREKHSKYKKDGE